MILLHTHQSVESLADDEFSVVIDVVEDDAFSRISLEFVFDADFVTVKDFLEMLLEFCASLII